MNVNQLIGARIKQIREDKNILQKNICDELNISKNTYSSIENGHTKVTVEMLFQLAKFFQVGVDFILDIDAKQNQSNIHKNNVVLYGVSNNGKVEFHLTKDFIENVQKKDS
jgi:transcriptional regulator with XRE-family HTH domain